MYSRCSNTARTLSLAVVVLGAVLTHRAEASPVVKVCVDKTNPTWTMDARVARAALKTQGYGFQRVFFVGHGKRADVPFPIKRFAQMAQSECQLIMGFPVDIDQPQLPPNVKSTAAYASTGFVLVEPGHSKPTSLEQLPKGSEVGIAQVDTWAGMLYSTHPNIVMHVYTGDSEMLTDLEHHKIAAGMTWQPYLQAYETKHGGHVALDTHMLPGKHMVWNLVALYVPTSQNVADDFVKGVAALQSSGKLKALISPYRAATAEPARDAAARGQGDHSMASSQRDRLYGGKFVKVAAKKTAVAKSPPALYTEDQATQGQIAYYQNCAMCHGSNLGGQEEGSSGPALKGSDFADPSYDFHVSDIFNFVANMMPAMSPGSLPHDTSVNIMAFILKANGYPAGKTELTYDAASKSKVPIYYYGKKDSN